MCGGSAMRFCRSRCGRRLASARFRMERRRQREGREDVEEARITRTYQPMRRDGKPYKHPPKPVIACLYVCDDSDYLENAIPATEEDLAAFGFVRAEALQSAGAGQPHVGGPVLPHVITADAAEADVVTAAAVAGFAILRLVPPTKVARSVERDWGAVYYIVPYASASIAGCICLRQGGLPVPALRSWLTALATGRPASAGLIDLDGQTLEEAFAAAATAMRDAPLPVDDERIAGCVGETWKRALAHAEEASHAAQDAPAAEDAAAPAGDGLLHPDPIFFAPLPTAAGEAPGAPA